MLYKVGLQPFYSTSLQVFQHCLPPQIPEGMVKTVFFITRATSPNFRVAGVSLVFSSQLVKKCRTWQIVTAAATQ